LLVLFTIGVDPTITKDRGQVLTDDVVAHLPADDLVVRTVSLGTCVTTTTLKNAAWLGQFILQLRGDNTGDLRLVFLITGIIDAAFDRGDYVFHTNFNRAGNRSLT
jgi:hypothetical protein